MKLLMQAAALVVIALLLALLLSQSQAGAAAHEITTMSFAPSFLAIPTSTSSPTGSLIPAITGTPQPMPTKTSAPTPTRSPRPRATAMPTSILSVIRGTASTYGPGYVGWVALPQGPGWRFKVCGPSGCLQLISNDKGPNQSIFPKRIVDLDVASFEAVCGKPWTKGTCQVIVTIEGRG